MYTWEQIKEANSLCKTTDVKDKPYVEVNQRIKAFRSVCPGGAIVTDMLSNRHGYAQQRERRLRVPSYRLR